MLEVMATILLIVWTLLAIQTFLNLVLFRRLEPASSTPKTRVSIVIPARNEERYIGRTLDAALQQDYADFEIIVVDDESTDGTAEAIASRASDERLVALNSRPLQPGWLGKPNALATGAARATGTWLLFMDADVELHPLALRDAVSACEENGWDHLALLPELERRGFWEGLLMPLIPAVAFIYMPSYLTFLPGTKLAAGAGAFGLVKRDAYDRAGGHDKIRNSVVDDVRLALELRKAGAVSRARIGTHRLRLRMYHGLSEILEGFTKNAHAGFGNSVLLPVITVLVSLWLVMGPFSWPVLAAVAPAVAFESPYVYLGWSLLLLVLTRVAVDLRLRLPLWAVALSPLATVMSIAVVLRSLRMVHQDGVVRWRGREYPRELTEF